MQFEQTLDDVRDQVHTDDDYKWDSIAPVKSVTLHHGRLLFPDALFDGFDTGLALTPWAMAQACNRLGLPTAYVKKCPPLLQDANFNYWAGQEEALVERASDEKKPVDSWLIRAKGTTVRAVLSPSYAKLDNRQLLEALFPVIAATKYKVGLVHLSSEAFHLRLVEPSICREVLPGDRIQVGIHVSNSEVGLHACTVDALVFRVLCSNGLIRRINHRSLLKQRHIHVSEPRFKEMLAEAVFQAVEVATLFLEQMALSIKVPVPNPIKAIAVLAEAWNLPKRTQELIESSLHGERYTQTLYGLTNAITATAQRLNMEERFRLETIAGILIDGESEVQADHILRQRILSGVK